MNLEGTKATHVRDTPTDMLKQRTDIHIPIRTQIIDMSIDNKCSPNDIKIAEVSPVLKVFKTLMKKIIDQSVFYLMCCLEKNCVPTNRRFHERQIVKSFNRL